MLTCGRTKFCTCLNTTAGDPKFAPSLAMQGFPLTCVVVLWLCKFSWAVLSASMFVRTQLLTVKIKKLR